MKNELADIKIYNILGEVIFDEISSAKSGYPIDISGLGSGIYKLKITIGNAYNTGSFAVE